MNVRKRAVVIAAMLGIGGLPIAVQTAPTAAAAGAVAYHGGPVLSHVRVVGVLWGNGTFLPELTSSTGPNMSSFLANATNSPYIDWLSEYSTPTRTIGRGAFAGMYRITPSAPAPLYDDQIGTELLRQLALSRLPLPDANTMYMLFLPAGTNGGILGYHAGCAWHENIVHISFAVIPDQATRGGCLGGGRAFDSTTVIVSHELVETITDPEFNAWDEIADPCQGGMTGSVFGLDYTRYAVAKAWSNRYNACIDSTAPPAVTSLSTTSGMITGGTKVIVRGSHLAGSSVTFGGVPATSVTAFVDDEIIAVSPPHPSGAVHVVVRGPTGVSVATAADMFTYVSPSAPVVVADRPGYDSIFVRGADNMLYVWSRRVSDGALSPMTNLGIYLYGQPVVIARSLYGGPIVDDIYVRGIYGLTFYNWVNPDAPQQSHGTWMHLGAPSASGSDPAVVTSPTRMPFEDVYLRDVDNQLRWFAVNTAAPAAPTWWLDLPGSIFASPVVVARANYGGANIDDIFVRSAYGSVFYNWVNVDAPQYHGTSYAFTGAYSASDPTVVMSSDRLPWADVYIRNYDNRLKWTYVHVATADSLPFAGPWYDFGAYALDRPTVVRRTAAPGWHIDDVFVAGAYGIVSWNWFDADAPLTQHGAWTPLGIALAAPAVSTTPSRVPNEDVYVLAVDGTIEHATLNAGVGYLGYWTTLYA